MEKTALEQLIEQAKNTRATSLMLNGLGILDLPESIANCNDLIYLYLENNRLSSLPDIICNLPELNYLNIGNNMIEHLPESITNLLKLNGLCLRDNPIKDFTILQELPKLQYVLFGKGYFHRKYWSSYEEWHPQYLLDLKEEEMRVARIESEQNSWPEC